MSETGNSSSPENERPYPITWNDRRNAVFATHSSPDSVSQLQVTDARVIAESSLPRHGVYGINPRHPIPGTDDMPKYIITSPNMDWVPDLSLDTGTVFIRNDGRFAYHDPTIWPQWYFEETAHLPYILRKPGNAAERERHPYSILWHDLTRQDFNAERGIVSDAGLISAPIMDRVRAVRKELESKFERLLQQDDRPKYDLRPLRRSAEGMQLSAVVLSFAAQSFPLTLITFTLFQRHALEALAAHDMLSVWEEVSPSLSIRLGEERRDLVGTITHQVTVAAKFHAIGVPVWLVRPPHAISNNTIILRHVWPLPVETFQAAIVALPAFLPYFNGGPSFVRNAQSTALRLGHIAVNTVANPAQLFSPTIEASTASGPSHISRPPAVRALAAVRVAGSPVRRLNPYKGIYAVDETKFTDPCPSLTALYVANVWCKALLAVDRDKTRRLQHDDSELFHGYPVIDPHLIQNVTSERCNLYLVSWVFIRSAWMGLLFSRKPIPFPTAQEWREMCMLVAEKLGLVDVRPPPTKPPAKRQKNRRPLIEAFAGLQINVTTIPDLYFKGRLVVTAHHIRNRTIDIHLDIRRDVLFDAWEHNFRLELLGLERAVYFRGLMTEKEVELREGRLSKLFAGEHPINPNLTPSPENFGSGSSHTLARAKRVEAFAALLYGWGGDALRLHALKLPEEFTVADVDRLELQTYQIYCDTFFTYFGRAPSVPRIPHHSDYLFSE